MYLRQLSWVSKPVTYRDWTVRLIETQDYPVLHLWHLKTKRPDWSVLRNPKTQVLRPGHISKLTETQLNSTVVLSWVSICDCSTWADSLLLLQSSTFPTDTLPCLSLETNLSFSHLSLKFVYCTAPLFFYRNIFPTASFPGSVFFRISHSLIPFLTRCLFSMLAISSFQAENFLSCTCMSQ